MVHSNAKMQKNQNRKIFTYTPSAPSERGDIVVDDDIAIVEILIRRHSPRSSIFSRLSHSATVSQVWDWYLGPLMESTHKPMKPLVLQRYRYPEIIYGSKVYKDLRYLWETENILLIY